jgi:hypothetical protein
LVLLWFNSRLKVSFIPVSNRKYARNMIFLLFLKAFILTLEIIPRRIEL